MAINLEILKKMLKSFRISNMSVYTLVSDSFVHVTIMLLSCYHFLTIYSIYACNMLPHVTTIFKKIVHTYLFF